MRVVVNGLPQDIHYDAHAIDDVLVPALSRWMCDTNDDARHWAFFAAPPGAGKSTLLELIAAKLPDLQCLGIDGFHYPNSYLRTAVMRSADGTETTLASVKGAPETFDIDALEDTIVRSAYGNVMWPVYDRTIHDPRPDAIEVTSKHVLLEGTWLLLKDERWAALRAHADFTIFLAAAPDLVKERLIRRKVQGGLSEQEAADFYQRSDEPNVARVMNASARDGVNLELEMAPDGSIHEREAR